MQWATSASASSRLLQTCFLTCDCFRLPRNPGATALFHQLSLRLMLGWGVGATESLPRFRAKLRALVRVHQFGARPRRRAAINLTSHATARRMEGAVANPTILGSSGTMTTAS